jgi:hypothetical protein
VCFQVSLLLGSQGILVRTVRVGLAVTQHEPLRDVLRVAGLLLGLNVCWQGYLSEVARTDHELCLIGSINDT